MSQTDSKQARAACRASCSVSARSGVAAGGALAVAAAVAAGERMGSLPGAAISVVPRRRLCSVKAVTGATSSTSSPIAKAKFRRRTRFLALARRPWIAASTARSSCALKRTEQRLSSMASRMVGSFFIELSPFLPVESGVFSAPAGAAWWRLARRCRAPAHRRAGSYPDNNTAARFRGAWVQAP